MGSSGYLGQNLKSYLAKENIHEILTLNRADLSNSYLFKLSEGNKEILGDLRDHTFLNETNDIDVIVNALGDVTKTDFPQNIESLVHANSIIPAIVASRFRNSSVRFIQVGTFSHKSDLLQYQPQSFYAATKFAGENFLKYFSEKNNLSIVVFHTYDIYGEYQPHDRLLRYLINSIQSRTKILTTPGEQEFTPIYIKDLVKNIFSAISQEPKPNGHYIEFDAFGPETFKVRDLPAILSEYIGIPLEPNQVEMKLPYTGKEIFKFNPCHKSLISRDQMTPLSAGIKRIIEAESQS